MSTLHAILRALTCKVRVLTRDQVAELGAGDALLRHAVEHDLLRTLRAFARPCPPLQGPLATWRPGEPPLNCGPVAYRIQERWQEPCRSLPCYVATPRAARLFGRPAAGLKNPLQCSHDIVVGDVLLWHLRHAPELAEAWTGEDAMDVPRGQKRPDAFFVVDGLVVKVLEVGGCCYSKERVAALHRFLAERGVPHEIW